MRLIFILYPEQHSIDWVSLVSMLATVSTAIIAAVALFSWRHQKLYDLKIESLAKSRQTMNLIALLRNPVSFGGEIDQEYEANYLKYNKEITPVAKQYLLFHSRIKANSKLYDDILILREKIWANFEDNHPFYVYYDYVVSTINQIGAAHRNRQLLAESDYLNHPDRLERFKELDKIISTSDNDKMLIELNRLFSLVEEKRSRKRYKFLPIN